MRQKTKLWGHLRKITKSPGTQCVQCAKNAFPENKVIVGNQFYFQSMKKILDDLEKKK